MHNTQSCLHFVKCEFQKLQTCPSVARTRNLSLLQISQIKSAAHTTFCTMDTSGPFPGLHQPECEADHSPASTTYVKYM
jgi:hypothetical protein